jgi:hypothetical protein
MVADTIPSLSGVSAPRLIYICSKENRLEIARMECRMPVRGVELATDVLPLVLAVPVERLPRAGTAGGHQ